MDDQKVENAERPGKADRLDSWLEAHTEQMLKDLAGLVEIDSVAQEPADQTETVANLCRVLCPAVLQRAGAS